MPVVGPADRDANKPIRVVAIDRVNHRIVDSALFTGNSHIG